MVIKLMNDKNEPKLIYSIEAFTKILKYLNTTHAKSYEFMFLGLVEPYGKIDYYISDFILPPQETSQAYCETNDLKYPEWLIKNVPIEKRSLIRCHAHSHVYMQTSPSGTDNTMIDNLCKNVSNYFIQLIVNQKLENTINIWDKTNNLIYENLNNYIEIDNKDYYILLKIISKTNIEIETLNIKSKKIDLTNNILEINKNLKYDLINNYLILNTDELTLYINKNTSNIITNFSKKETEKIEEIFKENVEQKYAKINTNNDYSNYYKKLLEEEYDFYNGDIRGYKDELE